MRVAAISGTHGRQGWSVPCCDVLVHAGDMTGDGSLRETALFAKRLEEEMDSPVDRNTRSSFPGTMMSALSSSLSLL